MRNRERYCWLLGYDGPHLNEVLVYIHRVNVTILRRGYYQN